MGRKGHKENSKRARNESSEVDVRLFSTLNSGA